MEEEKKPKKIHDRKSAKIKIEQYCVYQERSQQEVRDKLYDLGLHQKDVEEIISELIGDNFLNEERFAITYARGKFRLKHWGKNKIKQELKKKRVSEYCIKKALSLIDNNEYLQSIQDLANKKQKDIKDKDAYVRNNKLARFLISKGYEADLVWDILL